MRERLSASMLKKCIRSSQMFEEYWEILTHRRDHPEEEFLRAVACLEKGKAEYQRMAEEGLLRTAGLTPEVCCDIFMGLFHYDISPPPELDRHLVSRS